MIDNIKTLWGYLSKEGKDKAANTIMAEYGLTSLRAFRQNYIYGGDIPEERQPRILEILQNAVREQNRAMEKYMSA